MGVGVGYKSLDNLPEVEGMKQLSSYNTSI